MLGHSDGMIGGRQGKPEGSYRIPNALTPSSRRVRVSYPTQVGGTSQRADCSRGSPRRFAVSERGGSVRCPEAPAWICCPSAKRRAARYWCPYLQPSQINCRGIHRAAVPDLRLAHAPTGQACCHIRKDLCSGVLNGSRIPIPYARESGSGSAACVHRGGNSDACAWLSWAVRPRPSGSRRVSRAGKESGLTSGSTVPSSGAPLGQEAGLGQANTLRGDLRWGR